MWCHSKSYLRRRTLFWVQWSHLEGHMIVQAYTQSHNRGVPVQWCSGWHNDSIHFRHTLQNTSEMVSSMMVHCFKQSVIKIILSQRRHNLFWQPWWSGWHIRKDTWSMYTPGIHSKSCGTLCSESNDAVADTFERTLWAKHSCIVVPILIYCAVIQLFFLLKPSISLARQLLAT